ncbi:MAG: pseudaminic acid synthase [Crocinitomicaceae bacterium]|nr:pseudaminic acid synthase [Crocinitomicaceae bacterium]
MAEDIKSKIFGEEKVFIIAELSANHNQNLNVALETVKAAKKAGADAIKLQTYTPDTMTLNVDKEEFRIKGTIWDGRNLYELYKEAYTPWEWHQEIMKQAEMEGLICFSSPFDKTSVDFLETLNVPAYKIASFEITDLPLIDYISKLNKPMIISTGIATDKDIEKALKVCRDNGLQDIALLKCTSAYPAKVEDANLIMIEDMKKKFNTIVGLSDHSLGITVPLMSVAFGARIIEKHFILDRNLGGPDAAFSLTPEEFKDMVDHVREAEKAIGKVDYSLDDKKKASRVFSRSIFISANVKKGDTITEDNIIIRRPNVGLPPEKYYEVLGKTFTADFEFGVALTEKCFQ